MAKKKKEIVVNEDVAVSVAPTYTEQAIKEVTMIEKYQEGKDTSIAIRTYFDGDTDNMGLENYGMSLFEGVVHQEELSCLEINGIKVDEGYLKKLSKKLNLTKDPIWYLLGKVTVPASVGSLFQTFYNLVDTWFAGKISAEAIGAIAKSFPIYFTIIAVGVGIGAATNAIIGNSIGEKKERIASMYIAQSLIFALFISILVTLFGLNASNFLLGIMGSDVSGIALTREYLDIIFPHLLQSLCPILLYNVALL